MVGVSFALLLISQPLHQVVSANLGGRMAAHLYDRLITICVAPPGIAHLERSELTTDLTMARDFDLGMMGPPLEISMDFIAGGLVDLVVGVSAAILLAAFHWWAALLLVLAWLSTHWLLRESGVWKDRNTDEVRKAQRHAEYSYRLAVDAAPAKELRFFGLAGWVTDRFVSTRRRLYQLQYEATRLREKSVLSCLVVVLAANVVVFWLMADGAAERDVDNGTRRGLRAGRDRRLVDCVRRTELGDGRRRRTCCRASLVSKRRSAPARWPKARRSRSRAPRRSAFVTSRLPTSRVAVLCSTGST